MCCSRWSRPGLSTKRRPRLPLDNECNGGTRAVALLAGHIAAAVSHPSELEPQPAIVPLAAGLSAGAPGTDDCFGPAPVIPAVNTLRAGIRSGCPPVGFGACSLTRSSSRREA